MGQDGGPLSNMMNKFSINTIFIVTAIFFALAACISYAAKNEKMKRYLLIAVFIRT